MTVDEKTKKAIEKAKESANQIFKEKPDEIKKELEKETTLGNAENLVKPDDENE